MGNGASARRERKVRQRADRVEHANELLCFISKRGRRFFSHGDRVAEIEVDDRGRLWLVQEFNARRVIIRDPMPRGFIHGGTLARFVIRLATYIRTGRAIPPRSVLGPWPEWYSDSDPWGYGEDMERVRSEAARLGIYAPADPAHGEPATQGDEPTSGGV